MRGQSTSMFCTLLLQQCSYLGVMICEARAAQIGRRPDAQRNLTSLVYWSWRGSFDSQNLTRNVHP